MTEIILPKNWMNVREYKFINLRICAIGHADHDETLANLDGDEIRNHDLVTSVVISKSFYKDVQALVDEINKQLQKEKTTFINYARRSARSQFAARAERDGWFNIR